MFGWLPLVHQVKFNTGVTCLDVLEESSESLLEAVPSRWTVAQVRKQN